MFRPDRQPSPRFTEEKPAAPKAGSTQPETGASQGAAPVQDAPEELSIGEQIAAQLDTVMRRERELREVQDLALRRVAELRGDQLRRVLEFVE